MAVSREASDPGSHRRAVRRSARFATVAGIGVVMASTLAITATTAFARRHNAPSATGRVSGVAAKEQTQPADTPRPLSAARLATATGSDAATATATTRVGAHGNVSVVELAAPDAAGGVRAIWVYRPAVPDSATLPVLYFLHGLPGSAEDLAGTGIVAQLDTAFAAGALAPFVVAAPDGNSTGATDPEWANATDGSVDLESFLTGPAIAAVEGPNRRDRSHRAIAGFSMGGYGAMNIALRHPGLYGQVVSLAGYFHPDDPSGIFENNPATLAANSPDQHLAAAASLRIMLADGEQDTEAVVEGETQRFAGLLRAAGQDPNVAIVAGGHDWTFVAGVLPGVEDFLEQGWEAQ